MYIYIYINEFIVLYNVHRINTVFNCTIMYVYGVYTQYATCNT